jgi:biopolymer transport protein ExbD
VLGYSLGFVGIVVLLGPALIRIVDPFAPDASMKAGEGLAHDSVELRRQRRLPLRNKFTVLPNRGLIGGALILLLLLPVFFMVSQHELARGIYVRLVPQHHSGPDEVCLLGPVVVTVRQHGSVTQLFLDGTEVRRERLEEALKSELARRANWEVFVEGDDSVSFADPMFVVDAINTLHAKAVIMTPRLKEQMAKTCASR